MVMLPASEFSKLAHFCQIHNGMMKDLSVLQEPPFTDQGSIVEVFTDLTVLLGIRRAIEQVNANAAA